MIKYRVVVKVKSWLTEERKANTEFQESESFYFKEIDEALNKLKYIDMHREEYLNGRNAEIIKLRIEKIENVKEI